MLHHVHKFGNSCVFLYSSMRLKKFFGDERLYDVQSIETSRRTPEGNLELLIRWKGFPFSEATWELFGHIRATAPELTQKWEKLHQFKKTVQRSSTPPGHFPTPEKREGWMTGAELSTDEDDVWQPTPPKRKKTTDKFKQYNKKPATTTASSTTTTCVNDDNNNNDSELFGRLVIDEDAASPPPPPVRSVIFSIIGRPSPMMHTVRPPAVRRVLFSSTASPLPSSSAARSVLSPPAPLPSSSAAVASVLSPPAPLPSSSAAVASAHSPPASLPSSSAAVVPPLSPPAAFPTLSPTPPLSPPAFPPLSPLPPLSSPPAFSPPLPPAAAVVVAASRPPSPVAGASPSSPRVGPSAAVPNEVTKVTENIVLYQGVEYAMDKSKSRPPHPNLPGSGGRVFVCRRVGCANTRIGRCCAWMKLRWDSDVVIKGPGAHKKK
ncbi:hypothetical protein niasHS_001322 [Heterodera schachtii]|uniref:Chromo domain-containing protein n=1 Tax=Heterodera schachtii TaxID=97005 RepID=A0ABD2KJD7_HETSC